MTATDTEQSPAVLYQRFLRAFNSQNYEEIGDLIAADFEDHHPGFDVHGLANYQDALRGFSQALAVQGEIEDIISVGDKTVTRVLLRGRHVGELFGIPATGKEVAWTTTEVWRAADGRFVERWAVDDLLGLREQISEDAANVALIAKLNDVVNERRYDDMDELFAADFVDRNPAWNVEGLAPLKTLIADAHKALDFTSHHDQIYAADGGKVVIHITFSGSHVGPFFGCEPTGKPVSWTSIEVYRIVGRKIAERWVQADTAGLMHQVGVDLPA
jgi:predicted ester cyclase